MVVKAKTFFNCFFYASANEKGNAVENDILEYVTHAQRINYGDASFKAIKEQLRTRATSVVLYRILQRGELALCVYKKELPSSFKVFCAKDKLNGNKKTIFVDCTGLVEYQNGMFYCKDIDRLATYLSGALVHMIYYSDPGKFVNNANLQKSSVSAFVKMFARVMDYLKVNNYLQNKERILYITGVYFGYNVFGLDIESAKRVSAVVNRVNEMERKSHDMRYIEDDLANIDVFMNALTRTFKLEGMNTAVFANKWLYLYGKGTLYSLELLPAFLCTMMYAYAGTYVNYWKAIETVCGKDMTDIVNMVFKIGTDMYSRGANYESAEMRRNFEKIAIESSVTNPPNGFSFRSVDDKDFNMESYTLEMELGGMINLNEEDQNQQNNVVSNSNDTKPANETQEKDTATEGQPTSQSQSNNAEKETQNNPQTNNNTTDVKDAQAELKQKNGGSEPAPTNNNNNQQENNKPSNEAAKLADKVESAEETMKKVKAMKEAAAEKRLQAIKEEKAARFESPKEISKEGLEAESKDQGVDTHGEIKDLVDQLDEDNPMDENADLGDDQEAIEEPFNSDNPMNDDTEAEDFLDAVVDDNPMHEDAYTDKMQANLDKMKALQKKADEANKKASDALDSANAKFGIKREDAEDLGDGVETAKEVIDNHDSVGEPRDSEEVKELVDALDNDNPM